MNATHYTKLVLHHERHVYKRGAFTGDAPCDDRRKNHFRIIKPVSGQPIAVRFHRADIITVTPEGAITLNSAGWSNAPTTREAFRTAFARMGLHWYLYSSSPHGVSQTYLKTDKGNFVFYDRMQFNAQCELITPLAPVQARRIDKAESKEFRDACKASGFTAMFPLLYATCTPPTARLFRDPRVVQDRLTDADSAHHWPDIIASFKYERRNSRGWRNTVKDHERTAKECWSAIMSYCKRGMYNIIDLPTNI